MEPIIRPEILSHYGKLYDEAARLSTDGLNRVELMRTQEIIGRYLPTTAAVIADIGGGPGVYAEWLTSLGHEVHLIDPVESHVEQALQRTPPPASARVGHAGAVGLPDSSVDLALLLGPLYHLPERSERLEALQEGRRILRPGGWILAAGISRYAPTIDGLDTGAIDDDVFERIVANGLETGRHVNNTGDPRYFTTAYFHRPDELATEMTEIGFTDVMVLAVEGLAWAAPDLDERVGQPAKLTMLLDLLRRLETDESILGASPHLLSVGRA